ncbi:hypothetical protein SLA2020_055920 [Shorea laevis]
MENFKCFSGSEGCSSSESGWTNYISSPMQEDAESSQENDDNNSHYRNYSYNGDRKESSDDSMASDASSGPSHQQRKFKNGRDSHSNSRLKNDKGDYSNKCNSRKEAKKQEKRGLDNGNKNKGRFSSREKNHK